ncbi:unnamed protein product [Hermetia illucens]|uniref:beta-N-acetylhexosaminidase n=2 Tax=Hermetia illucens TaxID=343691 RepID=A0A7R8V176_HERIL|nr:unnamed protein product [Hermetia illucens]
MDRLLYQNVSIDQATIMHLVQNIFLALCTLLASCSAIEVSVPKKWSCNEDENCVPYVGQKSLESPSIYETQDICRLSCGRYGPLWPRPTGAITISQGRVNFNPKNIRVDIFVTNQDAATFLEGARDIFISNVWKECGKDCELPGNHMLIIQVRVAQGKMTLDWSTEESYVLVISSAADRTFVDVQSSSVYGARHALETLAQFITAAADNSSGLVMVSSARVVDKPLFNHRGVLLDTSRNFMPVNIIKRTLDGMAASKLNVFHWHATDSHSFPLEIPQVPQLQRFGAYSAEETYSYKEMEDIVKYARQRGIRVLIEIDSPAHVSNGWQWGPLGGMGDLAICINQQPWRQFCIQPPCGQMNIVNENLYEIMKLIYEDIAKITPGENTMHLGGDEVRLECWNASTEILNKMRDRGLQPNVDGFHQLWSEFHHRTHRIWSDIKQTGSKGILWSSKLTDPEKIEQLLPANKFIIQTWVPTSDPLVRDLLVKGYQLIVTPKDGWYLDHGFWGVTNYYNWRSVYDKILPRDLNILGGEVCMWSEYVDEFAVESRIWPRAGAAAERLWSDPSTSSREAESRFNRYRKRLIARGIGPDAVTPKWCTLNEGECH